jgi:hypothetical protein
MYIRKQFFVLVVSCLEKQAPDDPYVAGPNSAVGRGIRSFG